MLARFGHHYMGGQLYNGYALRWLRQGGRVHRCYIYMSNGGQPGFWIKIYAALVFNEHSFMDLLPPAHGYFVSDVQFDFTNPTTAIFKAKLNGPEGKPVWARAGLSTEVGTLAEVASPQMTAGDEVMLEVRLQTAEPPQFAYMRIESAPLQTEHVVMLKLG